MNLKAERWAGKLAGVAVLMLASGMTMLAQDGGTVQGTVGDAKGGMIAGRP